MCFRDFCEIHARFFGLDAFCSCFEEKCTKIICASVTNQTCKFS